MAVGVWVTMWMFLVPTFAAEVGPQQPVYDAVVASIEARRRGLDDVAGARRALWDAIVDDLVPRWTGTPWSFYGNAEAPGVEPVACGYYVSAILRDAGLRVERVRLAQQASEHIIQTLVPEARIRRFRDRPAGEVVAHVARRDGVWIVGLDFHVGFLIAEGGQVQFCHSTFLDEAGAICEDPSRSDAFVSRYRVVGELLGDDVVRGWLDGKQWPTVTK